MSTVAPGIAVAQFQRFARAGAARLPMPMVNNLNGGARADNGVEKARPDGRAALRLCRAAFAQSSARKDQRPALTVV
jgi:hypothetical protein